MEMEAKVWRTPRRPIPLWLAQIEVAGLDMAGNEYWPCFRAWTRDRAERKARRWATRHSDGYHQARAEREARDAAARIAL